MSRSCDIYIYIYREREREIERLERDEKAREEEAEGERWRGRAEGKRKTYLFIKVKTVWPSCDMRENREADTHTQRPACSLKSILCGLAATCERTEKQIHRHNDLLVH